MIKFIVGGVGLFMLLVLGSCSFTKVSQGHVGVKVNNLGSDAGVNDKALGVGWYFTPPGVTIYEYPVFTNNYTWKGDERLTFQDKNGLSISADVSVAYRADPSRAPVLFQKYRVDMDGVLAGALRNTVRNAIVSNASTMNVEQIYGPQKAALIEKARKQAEAYLAPFGLHVEQLYWASNIILPRNIQDQINQRVANEQEALAAQASVATAEANGRAKVATAEAEAKAIAAKATAQAETPEMIAIKKWDGKLPTYITAGAPMPFIGKAVN